MQNRPKGVWTGGDMIQLEKTQEALQKLGIDVTFNDQPLFTPALLLSDFDICHTWNFSMEWTKWQVWAAKRHGLKIVCSMIYHDTDRFISYDNQQIMIDALDMCIFLTEGEVERARRNLTIPDEKIRIIPNGIDSHWLTTPKTSSTKYRSNDYILTVGRLDGTKGQLETAIACKNLELEYLCVGEILDEQYADQCKKAGATLIGKVPHDELIVFYDNAKLNVLASGNEIFPLTVMEAGARGLNSVVTDTCEWKDIPQVEWCTWQDVDSIEQAIIKALKKPDNKKFKEKLQDMTWDSVAKSVMDLYNEIL